MSDERVLPDPAAVLYPDSGFRQDEHAIALWKAHQYDTGGEPFYSADQLHSYAANRAANPWHPIGRHVAAELFAAAATVQHYLMPSDAAEYRNASYSTPAQRLRQQADEMERKDEAIARFNRALTVCERALSATTPNPASEHSPETSPGEPPKPQPTE